LLAGMIASASVAEAREDFGEEEVDGTHRG
jgi:hypothetical protein